MLTQLLWQASTHPHPLYNSGATLRVSRSVHPHRHDARARAMAWAQPVPTALNAAQWATQDNPAHGRKTLLIQNGRLLLRGVAGWSEDTETECPLCLQACRAGALTEHVMLDCEALNAQRTSTLAAVHTIMQLASPPAAPESSARVAVPLPKALVRSVDACKQAAPAVPEAHRLTALRLLLCAQWPAHDERVLDLSMHESAALTWCGSPAVSTPKNAALDELPAKRKHQTLDSICIHPCWIKVCGRCAEWCATAFDALANSLLASEGLNERDRGDIETMVICING